MSACQALVQKARGREKLFEKEMRTWIKQMSESAT